MTFSIWCTTLLISRTRSHSVLPSGPPPRRAPWQVRENWVLPSSHSEQLFHGARKNCTVSTDSCTATQKHSSATPSCKEASCISCMLLFVSGSQPEPCPSFKVFDVIVVCVRKVLRNFSG